MAATRWFILAFFCYLVIFARLSLSLSSALDLPSECGGSSVAKAKKLGAVGDKKFAYAFYATTADHACGAFVNIAALRESGTSDPRISFVIVTYGFDKDVRTQAEKMNITVKAVAHLNNFKGGYRYYSNVMVKLRIFQLFEYDRVIFMDADMLVRKNLDHLFFLPEAAHIAGPRVYFQQFDGRPNYFCSCLMVFSPTPNMWDRIMSWYGPDGYVKEKKLYDMDLLNREFIDEATVLPGIYELLTSHLEGNAKWEKKLKEKLAEGVDMSRKLGMPDATIDEIYNASSVMHFTGSKPYETKSLGRVKGGTNERFHAINERWFTLAARGGCNALPGMKYAETHKYDAYF